MEFNIEEFENSLKNHTRPEKKDLIDKKINEIKAQKRLQDKGNPVRIFEHAFNIDNLEMLKTKVKGDLKAYLNDEMGLNIYDELTENENFIGLFDPLEFFDLLYDEYNYCLVLKKVYSF